MEVSNKNRTEAQQNRIKHRKIEDNRIEISLEE